MSTKATSSPVFNPNDLPDEFVKMYGGSAQDVRVFSAPARINIIGEHIDYNGGKVFPMAIDRYLYTAIRARSDKQIHYNDLRFPGAFSFSIDDHFAFKEENSYANILNGILSQLGEMNKLPPTGFDVLMASNIPAGGSISSSSALECGFAWAVNETFSLGLDRVQIAKLGQMSEHKFINVQCGIMDQFIIATGKAGTAEVLDCATLDYEFVPLELGDHRFVVMNTNKSRKLAESKYNERRSQCEQALDLLQKAAINLPADRQLGATDDSHIIHNTKDMKNLCDITPKQFDSCKHVIAHVSSNEFAEDVFFRRAQHCITEQNRVLQAVAALKQGNLIKLGELMKESHKSLHTDYEVTGKELDALANAAMEEDGCIGARMTGAGFAGCAIALVKKDKIDSFEKHVAEKYTKEIGYAPSFFSCESGDGVKEVDL